MLKTVQVFNQEVLFQKENAVISFPSYLINVTIETMILNSYLTILQTHKHTHQMQGQKQQQRVLLQEEKILIQAITPGMKTQLTCTNT